MIINNNQVYLSYLYHSDVAKAKRVQRESDNRNGGK